MNTTTFIPLPETVSIQVRNNDKIVFETHGKWLYPLFELEAFIEEKHLDPTSLILHDRIAGRAAASVMVRMGIRRCEIDLLSRPAQEVFIKHGVDYSYGKLVDRIKCRTEQIITADMTLDEVYALIRRNAGLIQGVDLEIKDLHVSYQKKKVLKGLSLSLKSGEELVITGDNGTGKTTLLKTLIGAVQYQRGSIDVGQKDKKAREIMGYVHQSSDSVSFPVTTDEIVASGLAGQNIGGKKLKYRVELAMRRTGCFHLCGRNFYTLSGGEKQRVSLARCLCQRAGIVLLDEPTSFLDTEAKEALLQLLYEIKHQHSPTMLLVSHDHSWIERLGWPVRVLKDGCLC